MRRGCCVRSADHLSLTSLWLGHGHDCTCHATSSVSRTSSHDAAHACENDWGPTRKRCPSQQKHKSYTVATSQRSFTTNHYPEINTTLRNNASGKITSHNNTLCNTDTRITTCQKTTSCDAVIHGHPKPNTLKQTAQIFWPGNQA
jgi:hypothetical protein